MQSKVYMKIDNSSFEHLAQFKYLGTTVTNKIFIQEKIKRRLNSGNAFCHSVQNVWSFHLLYKTQKLEYMKFQFFIWFCMSVKLGF
jgi:hypothetical protein